MPPLLSYQPANPASNESGEMCQNNLIAASISEKCWSGDLRSVFQ